MKQKCINSILSLLLPLFLVACASESVKIGSTVDSHSDVSVQLASRGMLLVAQKLSATADCESLKSRMTVSMTSGSSGRSIPTIAKCDYLKNSLVMVSKVALVKGTYDIVVRRVNNRGFRQNPVIFAKYVDPNFAGGPDYMIDGARELTTGQSLKGSVSYGDGNATDWIRLKGRNAMAGLTLVMNSDAKDVKAEVYELGSDGKPKKLVTTLQDRKKRMVAVSNSNLAVRIVAKPFLGKGEYTIVRADEGAQGTTSVARGLKIPVIDCYQVGENNSVVLLQLVSGVKVNDEVSVFGKKNTGETVALGSCQVTSIVGGQASCKMEGLVTGFVEYHAEGRIAG